MKKSLCIFVIFTALFLVGCRGADKSIEQNNNNNGYVNVKDSTINDSSKQDNENIANHLADLASSVPNVHGATAVVLGDFAVVGIDVDKDLERSEIGTIKYSVAESLKHDPHGARAIIIADPDLNTRLREIREDIANGKPIQGIMNELSDIVGRVMPEIPGNLEEQAPNDSIEKPKNQLNNNERKNLEKEQNDQSNDQK